MRKCTIGRMVSCSEVFYDQRCMVTASGKNYIATILSYSGRAIFLPSIVKTVYRKGSPMILIGRAGNNAMSNYIKSIK